MEKELKFVARSGFIAREVAGETILVPVDTGGVRLNNNEEIPMFNGIIQLNSLSLFLWNALSEPKSIAELTELVKENFDTSSETDSSIKTDIVKVLDAGIKSQIIFIIADK